MRTIILRRLAALLPTALLGSLIIFGIVHLTPGGPAAAIAGPDAGPEVIARINQELGLDRPILVQFGSWAWNLAHGDFGRSLINREYVSTLIAQRLPVTATLAMEALIHCAGRSACRLASMPPFARGTATDTAVKTLSGPDPRRFRNSGSGSWQSACSRCNLPGSPRPASCRSRRVLRRI